MLCLLLLLGGLYTTDLKVEEDTRDFEGDLQRGIRLYMDKDWDAASSMLKNATKGQANHPFALYLLACSEANRDKPYEAVTYLYQLTKIQSSTARAMLYSVYWDPAFDKIRKTNQFKSLMKNLDLIYKGNIPLAKHLSDAKLHYDKGMDALSHIEYEQAIMYFRFSTGYFHFYEAGYYQLAVCYARQGFPDKAVTALQELYSLKTGLAMRFLAMVASDRGFDDIRDNAKFKQFIQSIYYD